MQYQDRLLESGSLLHPVNRGRFEDTLMLKAEEDVRRELVHLQRAKSTVACVTAPPAERRQQEHESTEPEQPAHCDDVSGDPPESRGAVAARARSPYSARATHRVVSCEVSSFRDQLAGKEWSGNAGHDPLLSFPSIAGSLEAGTARGLGAARAETGIWTNGPDRHAPNVTWGHTSAPALAQADALASRAPGGAKEGGTPAGLLDAFLRLLDGGVPHHAPLSSSAEANKAAPYTSAGTSSSLEAELCAALADVPGLRSVQVERAQQVRALALAQHTSKPVSSKPQGRLASVVPTPVASVGLEIDAEPPHQVLEVLHVQDVHGTAQGQRGL